VCVRYTLGECCPSSRIDSLVARAGRVDRAGPGANRGGGSVESSIDVAKRLPLLGRRRLAHQVALPRPLDVLVAPTELADAEAVVAGRGGIRALEVILVVVGRHAGRRADGHVVVRGLVGDAGGGHGFLGGSAGGGRGGRALEGGDGRSGRDPAQERGMWALSVRGVDGFRLRHGWHGWRGWHEFGGGLGGGGG
jgi:hypothetical protein